MRSARVRHELTTIITAGERSAGKIIEVNTAFTRKVTPVADFPTVDRAIAAPELSGRARVGIKRAVFCAPQRSSNKSS